MTENEQKKILIIRLSALGDTIHTLPAVYALRQKYPKAQIDWVIEDKACKFIKNNPLVNNVYIIERKKRNVITFLQLISKIRKEKYDIALDFQQLLKSGLILGFSGAKRRITLDNGREFSNFFANEIIKTNRRLFDFNYHVVNRNFDLVKALGVNNNEIKFVLPDFSNEYSKEIKSIILDESKKIIVLAPSTTWTNKHWTIQGWRDIINEFKNDYNIILTADSQAQELLAKIADGYNNVINLAGKTNLCDLIYIFRKADLIVSTDSGSANIAWSVNAKSIITLFFATSAKRTAPFSDNYFSVSSNIECSPCMKRKCRLKNHKNKCITSINSNDIIQIMKKILV